MTGRHPGHCTRRDNTATGALDSFTGRPLLPLNAKDTTIASALKKAGYATGGFGKWGLGNPGTTGTPDKHGFDLFFGYLDQVHAHDYYTDHLVKNGGEAPRRPVGSRSRRQRLQRLKNRTAGLLIRLSFAMRLEMSWLPWTLAPLLERAEKTRR